MSSVQSTLITVGGTPTVFLPLPTAWSSGENCAANIYRYSATLDTYLAWDPVYGQRLATSATVCLPPQVTTWWLQPGTNLVYTALGPTFACPQAYTTVTTKQVVGNFWEEVYCCPSQYSVLSLQPNKGEDWPSQCTSFLTAGQTLSYVYSVETGGRILAVSTSTTVLSSATVFGLPVNGFNLATETSTGNAAASEATTQSSTTVATPQATTSSSSSASPSLGQIAGVCVGIILGVALIGVGVFLWWRRRRQKRSASSSHVRPPDPPACLGEAQYWKPSPSSPKELHHDVAPRELHTEAQHLVYELPGYGGK